MLVATTAACGGSEFSAADGEANGGSSSGGRAATGGSSGSGGSGGSEADGGTGGSGENGGTGTGGTGGDGGSSGSGGAVAGCIEYYRAYCAWADRCDTYLFGGSVEACESVADDVCAGLELPGITITGADYARCAGDLEAAVCTGTLVPCELPNGTIENGFGCGSVSQCKSGYCTGGNGACGVCAPNPRHPEGGECDNPLVDCEAELDCVEHVCTAKRQEGEACDDVHHCVTVRELGLLACVEGTCTAVALPGQPCPMSGDVPYCGYGTGCTTENVCVLTEKGDEGDQCGTFADRVVVCPEGTCVADSDDPSITRCVNWGVGGESCKKVPYLERCATGLVCENSLCVWPKIVPPAEDCD